MLIEPAQFRAFLAEKWLFTFVLSIFVTVIGYIHNPRVKTLIFSMPVPFTCVYLAAGLKIGPGHIVGLALGTMYHWIVYLIARRWRMPLGVGIAVGVLFFLGVAWLLRPLAQVHYLLVVGGAAALWAVSVMLYEPRAEPGHRSMLPVWFKFPGVFVVALGVLWLTTIIGPAAAVFPYAGVFTSYEMRHSLRTLAGQYMINNITFIFALSAMWWLETHFEVHPVVSLVAAWSIHLPLIAMIYRIGFGRPRAIAEAAD